jgi:subtilisin family serine protease
LLGNDLPANVTAKTFVDFQDDSYVDNLTPHGTACAEIVHDMAPDAQLYLLQVATDIDLGEAVDYAIAQGADVISTSLAWLNVTPGDGTGYFDQQADEARAAGIVWITAAGNYRESHWGGAFNDIGDGTHEFADEQNVNFFGPGNGLAIAIPAGQFIRVYVRWDDWQGINQDYNLHLVRWTGSNYSLVASSTNSQNGQAGQRPAEQITYVTSGSATVYGFVVERVNSGRDVNMEIFSPNWPVDVRVHERSLGNLADVGGVFTVAALDVNSPYPQEFYSSEGPINGPGGTQNGGGNKPDISAYANVSTSSYGAGGFNGTSSAAPHVAGAAALVLGVRPFYGPNQVQSLLQDRAADLGNPGLDALFGYGRLLLGEPLEPVVLDEHIYVPVILR